MGSYKLLLPSSFVALLALSAADAWSSATPVFWVEEVNVIAAEDNGSSDRILYRAGGCDGCSDGGAVSRQENVSVDGYIQFTVSSTDCAYYAGLSKGNADTSV